jgi:hypothetical protein
VLLVEKRGAGWFERYFPTDPGDPPVFQRRSVRVWNFGVLALVATSGVIALVVAAVMQIRR